jgi:hypothetical protein
MALGGGVKARLAEKFKNREGIDLRKGMSNKLCKDR